MWIRGSRRVKIVHLGGENNHQIMVLPEDYEDRSVWLASEAMARLIRNIQEHRQDINESVSQVIKICGEHVSTLEIDDDLQTLYSTMYHQLEISSKCLLGPGISLQEEAIAEVTLAIIRLIDLQELYDLKNLFSIKSVCDHTLKNHDEYSPMLVALLLLLNRLIRQLDPRTGWKLHGATVFAIASLCCNPKWIMASDSQLNAYWDCAIHLLLFIGHYESEYIYHAWHPVMSMEASRLLEICTLSGLSHVFLLFPQAFQSQKQKTRELILQCSLKLHRRRTSASLLIPVLHMAINQLYSFRFGSFGIYEIATLVEVTLSVSTLHNQNDRLLQLASEVMHACGFEASAILANIKQKQNQLWYLHGTVLDRFLVVCSTLITTQTRHWIRDDSVDWSVLPTDMSIQTSLHDYALHSFVCKKHGFVAAPLDQMDPLAIHQVLFWMYNEFNVQIKPTLRHKRVCSVETYYPEILESSEQPVNICVRKDMRHKLFCLTLSEACQMLLVARKWKILPLARHISYSIYQHEPRDCTEVEELYRLAPQLQDPFDSMMTRRCLTRVAQINELDLAKFGLETMRIQLLAHKQHFTIV